MIIGKWEVYFWILTGTISEDNLNFFKNIKHKLKDNNKCRPI